MNYKIIGDSSIDLMDLKQIPFDIAPLKIMTAQKEYVDDQSLDVKLMTDELKAYKGKSSTTQAIPIIA